MIAEESRDIAADDAAAILELVSQRRADAEFLVTGLTPSEYALYQSLEVALEPHLTAIEKRLAGDPPSLVVVLQLPKRWTEKAPKAFSAIVAGIVADCVRLGVKCDAIVPEHDRQLGRTTLPIDRVLRAAKSSHVIAIYSEPEQLEEELLPFCDVFLEIKRIDRSHFDVAIEREFDEPGVAAWPAGIKMSDVDPDLLDAVCGRAGAPSDVVRTIAAVTAARAKAAKRDAANEKQAEAAKTTSKSIYTPAILRPTTPTLANLHGYGAAAAWGHQLAEDVRDYQAGNLPWSDVDGGCLLHGPPGTGKTLFASALAATCGLPFIATSYAQWQSSGDGHLGYVIKAMRAVFESATVNAPSIIFIDEADTIRRRGGSGDGDGWWTAITNAALECVDGTSRREGIIIIAACNSPDMLDPALVRSGRLDRRFEIGLPDEKALLGIMLHHLPDAASADLAPAATALAGSASGADIARIAREARRGARREKRPVTAGDLLAIAIPPDTRPERDRRLVAVHESGHAVAMMSQGRIPDMLSIVSAGGSHGGVRSESPAGMGRLADLEDDIVVRLAGRAAEEVILGQPSAGAMGDLQQATDLATHIAGMWGLGGRLYYSEQVDGAAVESRLRDLYSRSLRLIGEHRAIVEKLADLALERRVLGRSALAAFAVEHGLGGGR
ncbi:hypothetical protein GCM10011335_35130 [Aureimonas glaciei]|uniref:AAA+ ATPase domain-containing protein n=2 Tax=Aureimonas glaciei TaxID=1776957 RepID=A0A916Y382_9HYPH|nr:hypothetical protein GCM10011335_35130 [Aureimonas glaciei]